MEGIIRNWMKEGVREALKKFLRRILEWKVLEINFRNYILRVT